MSDPWAVFSDAPSTQGSAPTAAAPAADPWAHYADAPPAQGSAAPPASNGADPWGHFADAPSPPDGVGTDVAKSAGVGLVKGTTGLFGTPGNLIDMAGNAAEYVGQRALKWAGALPDGAQPQSYSDIAAENQRLSQGTNWLPRSSDLDTIVQDAAGPYRQPQTKAGEYAQTIAEFAPSAAVGGGSVASRVVGGVLAPAVASETAGQLTKGSSAEPYARVAAALLGNAGAAGAGHISSAPTRAVVEALGDTTPAQMQAASDLQATGARIGLPLSGPEAIQHATGGATKLGDLMRFTEGTQRGGAVTAPFFAQRPAQIAAAGNATLDTIAPASAAPTMLGPQAADLAQRSIDDVRQGINTATRPAYAAAEQHIVDPADFAPIARMPAFQASLARLRADPVLGPAYANLPDNSGAVIDAVTKDMGARATALGNAANPGFQPEVAAAYGSGAADARDILRDPARGGTQAYDDALTMQAQARQQNLTPLEQGALGQVSRAGTTQQGYEALLPRQPLVGGEGDIGGAVGALAARDPAITAALLRQGLGDRLDQATARLIAGDNQAGGARFAQDIAGTAQQRANLDAAIGALPNGAAANASLNDLVDVYGATGRRRAPGSNTTADTAVGRELSTAPLPVEAVKAVRTLGMSIPGMVAERSRNFWLNRRADALGNLFVAPDSVDQIAAMAARGAPAPLPTAAARAPLYPSAIGALYAPQQGETRVYDGLPAGAR